MYTCIWVRLHTCVTSKTNFWTWINLSGAIDQTKRPMEFYNFLQVNTDSKIHELIDNSRKDEEEDVDQNNRIRNENCVPFFDFLSVGNSASQGLC